MMSWSHENVLCMIESYHGLASENSHKMKMKTQNTYEGFYKLKCFEFFMVSSMTSPYFQNVVKSKHK